MRSAKIGGIDVKILYLAPIPYDGLRQRPQYIADGLAQKHEVIYVNPTVSWLKYLLKGEITLGATQKCSHLE